jgi:uncharacterized protein YcaQ
VIPLGNGGLQRALLRASECKPPFFSRIKEQLITIHLSGEQARRFLVTYHFTPMDLPGVFARLGTVQYDPLNPVGRNPDLVLQARIPGYRVDDWQQAAYVNRLIYDAWDKQAS